MESQQSKNDFLPQEQPSWGDIGKNFAYIAVIIGIAYFITVRVGLDNIRETVSQAGIFAPLIVILLKATTVVVVPLGGAPLYPIAGAIWGFWQGLGITLIGDAIGSAIAFYISRLFGRSILKFFMSKQHLPMVERLIEKGSNLKTFLKARLFFSGFMELFAYAAGFTKIPFWIFLPVHVGIHAIGAALLVMFGEVLVTGSKFAMIGVGLIMSFLALGGIWWFHADLKRSS